MQTQTLPAYDPNPDDAQPEPEPASPSLPGPDPGVFDPDRAKPRDAPSDRNSDGDPNPDDFEPDDGVNRSV